MNFANSNYTILENIRNFIGEWNSVFGNWTNNMILGYTHQDESRGPKGQSPLFPFVVIGDGDDNASRYTRDQALEMAHKADVVIYTISTNISRIPTDGDKILRYFAEETGGLAFFPFKSSDLAQSFENIANELRHQYNVFYRPEPLNGDGLYHPVDIRIKNRKDLIVRARHGYYAPKL